MCDRMYAHDLVHSNRTTLNPEPVLGEIRPWAAAISYNCAGQQSFAMEFFARAAKCHMLSQLCR